MDPGGEIGHPAVLPGEGDGVGEIHTVFVFRAGAPDAVGPAEHHLRKVQGVHPHIQQRAARQLPGTTMRWFWVMA